MTKVCSGLLFALFIFVLWKVYWGPFRPVMVLLSYNVVPVIAGVTLALVAPLCIFGARPLLGNIFLVHNGR
jgi:hypothetical protein